QKGVTTVGCTAADPSNNTSSCSFTVTIQDHENPAISACPSNISQNTAAGQCSAAVSFTTPTASDNCSGSTTCSPASGATFQKGTTTVTCTATDTSANTAACSFTVTIADTQQPTITCPANITKNTDAGVCTATASY